MDPRRFDVLAKRLGARLSRRDALRMGAGAAAGVRIWASQTPVAAQDPGTTARDRFVSIRTYVYTGAIEDAESLLRGLVPLVEQQPGFISIHFVADDEAIHRVLICLDRTSAVAAATVEDEWLAEQAPDLFPETPDIRSGDVFLRSELHVGCPCTTGDEDACNSTQLTCCATSDVEGGPGICLTSETTCPSLEPVEVEELSVSEVESDPAPLPTAAPSTADGAACTGIGCACVAGVDGACEPGLYCCGTGEFGAPGICQASCAGVCTGVGCGCVTGDPGVCDDGLICCSTGGPGSIGACFANCGGGGGCTGDGCACIAGVPGACDPGLQCCGAESGAEGICQASCVSVGVCPGGAGCSCIDGVEGSCSGGLVCCGAPEPGGAGTCQSTC